MQPASTAGSSSAQHAHEEFQRPQLVLVLQDASELPAAMAVLAALYGVQEPLSQEQLVQAVVLAHKWELPTICTAAANALTQTFSSQGKLSEAATQRMLRLQAAPKCLQPLKKQVLLAVLGNWERCWRHPSLWAKLLKLPLCNMELLLSCDELHVGA